MNERKMIAASENLRRAAVLVGNRALALEILLERANVCCDTRTASITRLALTMVDDIHEALECGAGFLRVAVAENDDLLARRVADEARKLADGMRGTAEDIRALAYSSYSVALRDELLMVCALLEGADSDSADYLAARVREVAFRVMREAYPY